MTPSTHASGSEVRVCSPQRITATNHGLDEKAVELCEQGGFDMDAMLYPDAVLALPLILTQGSQIKACLDYGGMVHVDIDMGSLSSQPITLLTPY